MAKKIRDCTARGASGVAARVCVKTTQAETKLRDGNLGVSARLMRVQLILGTLISFYYVGSNHRTLCAGMLLHASKSGCALSAD